MFKIVCGDLNSQLRQIIFSFIITLLKFVELENIRGEI